MHVLVAMLATAIIVGSLLFMYFRHALHLFMKKINERVDDARYEALLKGWQSGWDQARKIMQETRK